MPPAKPKSTASRGPHDRDLSGRFLRSRPGEGSATSEEAALPEVEVHIKKEKEDDALSSLYSHYLPNTTSLVSAKHNTYA